MSLKPETAEWASASLVAYLLDRQAGLPFHSDAAEAVTEATSALLNLRRFRVLWAEAQDAGADIDLDHTRIAVHQTDHVLSSREGL